MGEDRTWIAERADAVPAHRRTIVIDVYDTPTTFEVCGRLEDRRPWADGVANPSSIHTMVLRLEVERATLTITRAEATMEDFPHAECPGIAPAFASLVGLSIARGFTKAVQDRFGRERGCSHLEFLARCLGPAVIQAIPSTAQRGMSGGQPIDEVLFDTSWLENTCHLWETGGVGQQKLAMGWRPGGRYPAPSIVELRTSGLEPPGDVYH